MQIIVRLFGPAAQTVGRREIQLMLDEKRATCADLRAALAASEPALQALLPACRIAVNQEFAAEDQLLRAGDEVALIGMVSGG